ncbi:Quinone oxidoreductase [Pseudomonas chlororaphis subsp. aureofaciens]|nr:Quinone oxidoreductase [Pseudomonas chlororaphis subsp. aureofaciens]
MVTRIQLHQVGAPQVLQFEQVPVQAPGAGEVWLEQTAIGVNPLDLSQRSGAVPVALPCGLGLEGAGLVKAIGPGVTQVQVGDRVAYATGPLGAYASARLYPAERLVKLPPQLASDAAAALLFKGITAQYLLKTTYPVGPGTRVLIYGAAGALGQLMVPWAKHLGATVIGVVSKAQSVERARAAGCDEVLVFDAATLAQQVVEITQGHKVDVVYDPIGRVSFEASLDSLRPRGLLVSFGVASGVPEPVTVGTLNAKGSRSSPARPSPPTRPAPASTRRAPPMCWTPSPRVSSSHGSGSVIPWPKWPRPTPICTTDARKEP